jgi:hypothetical protein
MSQLFPWPVILIIVIICISFMSVGLWSVRNGRHIRICLTSLCLYKSESRIFPLLLILAVIFNVPFVWLIVAGKRNISDSLTSGVSLIIGGILVCLDRLEFDSFWGGDTKTLIYSYLSYFFMRGISLIFFPWGRHVNSWAALLFPVWEGRSHCKFGCASGFDPPLILSPFIIIVTSVVQMPCQFSYHQQLHVY